VSAGAILAGGGLALGSGLALAHKWELGLRTSALALLACAAVACVAVTALDAAGALHAAVQSLLMAAIALALALGLVAWRFYRDPERLPPSHDNIIVSPADGVIAYVRATERGELPVAIKKGRRMRLDELVRTPLASEEATVIGIALTFLDVHVNRAPIAGVVKAHNRYPGGFASLKNPSAAFTNERTTTILEQGATEVAVVLIASRLVRRIVSFVRAGEPVALGQRIGAIRFGSQVDLVLPVQPGLKLWVAPGERVRAGETILAELGESDRSSPRFRSVPDPACDTGRDPRRPLWHRRSRIPPAREPRRGRGPMT
jgi:phosphatidylserine decarboxylase